MVTSLLNWITSSQEYFQSLGWLGILFYAAIFVAVQACLIPGAPLSLAAGVIFGLWGGFLAIELGTTGGVAMNFLISRHLAREAIAHRLGRNEKFRLIDAAIGREGWKIIAMLRLCPLPFGLSNYCYGLTAIPFWPYFIASVLAIIPANFFFVWLGASANESAQALLGGGRPRHPLEYALLGVGLVAAFAALTYIGKVARAAVSRSQA